MSKPCKIAILGSTGMLGYALGRYFGENPKYETHLSYRDRVHAYGGRRFYFDAIEYMQHPRGSMPFSYFDYVINCIGGIKQRAFNESEFTKINTTFPLYLATECISTRTKLIHVSTDCVFSGKTGNSTELTIPDPSDIYGASKLAGEPNSCMVLRTSLIGDELHSNVSLLEWTKLQAGNEINGFTNHFWNGNTTKQFAKICDDIIQKNLYETGLRHVFNPTPVSKAYMIKTFNDKFQLGLKINYVATTTPIDRTLSSIYDLNDKLNIPSFEKQMFEI